MVKLIMNNLRKGDFMKKVFLILILTLAILSCSTKPRYTVMDIQEISIANTNIRIDSNRELSNEEKEYLFNKTYEYIFLNYVLESKKYINEAKKSNKNFDEFELNNKKKIHKNSIEKLLKDLGYISLVKFDDGKELMIYINKQIKEIDLVYLKPMFNQIFVDLYGEQANGILNFYEDLKFTRKY